MFSLASHSAAVPKLRCRSTGAQRRAAVPLPIIVVVSTRPASRRLAPRAWLQLTAALTLFSVAVGDCTPPHDIELHQSARVVSAPSPPLLRLEHKPEVATGGSKLRASAEVHLLSAGECARLFLPSPFSPRCRFPSKGPPPPIERVVGSHATERACAFIRCLPRSPSFFMCVQ
jgi:hypothetical protein